MAGSVTHWIRDCQNGDAAAAQSIWERYHGRLLGLARQSLNGGSRRHADEEDVVQSSFQNLFQGMVEARFPRLDDRHDLWRLLVVITARRAIDQTRRDSRGRRHAVTPRPPSAISPLEAEPVLALEQVISQDPTPDMAAQLVEEYESRLNQLGDATLRRIAVWKLEGHTNGEIAAKLNCSRRTVIRKLDVIRLMWSDEAAP